MKPLRTLFAASLLLIAACCFADDAPAVKILFPKTAKAGAKVMGIVEVTFAEGLHGYQNPPSDKYQIPVKVALDGKGFKLVAVSYPKGISKATGGDPTPAMVYEGKIRIPVTLTMPPKPGAGSFKLVVSYQQCNDQACFPPATVTSAASITVTKAK